MPAPSLPPRVPRMRDLQTTGCATHSRHEEAPTPRGRGPGVRSACSLCSGSLHTTWGTGWHHTRSKSHPGLPFVLFRVRVFTPMVKQRGEVTADRKGGRGRGDLDRGPFPAARLPLAATAGPAHGRPERARLTDAGNPLSSEASEPVGTGGEVSGDAARKPTTQPTPATRQTRASAATGLATTEGLASETSGLGGTRAPGLPCSCHRGGTRWTPQSVG